MPLSRPLSLATDSLLAAVVGGVVNGFPVVVPVVVTAGAAVVFGCLNNL